MAAKGVTADDLGQHVEEAPAVLWAEVDQLAVVSPGSEVVEGAGELKTRRSADGASVGHTRIGRNWRFGPRRNG